jgi:hypothetical protein
MAKPIHPIIPMTARLTHQILDPASLTRERRDEVFALFSRCYDCVNEETFQRDLEAKTSIILLSDEAGGLVGFSTQQVYEWELSGEPIRIIYSGDTVIDPASWGSQELAKAWCRVAAAAMLGPRTTRTFWFLISKGCRTYLYLPLFFRHFIPGVGEAGAPNEWKGLLDELAIHKFGEAYDKRTGLIRFPASRGQLIPELATVPVSRRDDPHVAFFLERNPDYTKGVELACLAEVSLENTHGVGRRWLNQALSLQSTHPA